MGEMPEHVHDFGAPGLDWISRSTFAGRTEFEKATGFELGAENLLVTYHPVTIDQDSIDKTADALLSALDRFPDVHVIFTKANADPGGRRINAQLESWVARNARRSVCVASLGQWLYLSAMSLCDAVVGNSSSGLIEAPAFGRPTVNIGARQAGRLRAPSVIDCELDANSIESAIRRALSSAMKDLAAQRENPYGAGNASARIKDVLASADPKSLLVKRFQPLGRPC
jgi:UDP-hydrolysing UDP-N-acetyl-D-glucosamine 2-epimerase